jgi:hypothetical protein
MRALPTGLRQSTEMRSSRGPTVLNPLNYYPDSTACELEVWYRVSIVRREETIVVAALNVIAAAISLCAAVLGLIVVAKASVVIRSTTKVIKEQNVGTGAKGRDQSFNANQ